MLFSSIVTITRLSSSDNVANEITIWINYVVLIPKIYTNSVANKLDLAIRLN